MKRLSFSLFLDAPPPLHRPEMPFTYSDFIGTFLQPYMGVILNRKMVFIFQISCILVLIFPNFMTYFPKCEGKGSFPKSQIKSQTYVV